MKKLLFILTMCGALSASAKANHTADKELFIVPGATHIRTYFVKEYVDQISGKLRAFFTAKLATK